MPSKKNRIIRTVTPPGSSSSGIPASLLGFWVSGDLAGYTIYTTAKGRKVFYPESPAIQEPSVAQARCRNRFRVAYLNWKDLQPTEKKALEDACRALNLCLTGQNLWISTQLTGQLDRYHTVALQSGLPLPECHYIP
jgi:hypothetical protein